MAAAADRRLLLGIGGGLAAGAALLLLSLPGAPAPAPAPAAAADPTVLADTAPRTQPAAVAALVAACNTATASDLAHLRQLAMSPDPLVAGNAIRALGRIGAVHTDRQLLQRLHDPQPRVRHELIAALGGCGDAAAAVPYLEPLLRGDDEQARMLSISALVQLRATGPLQRLLHEPSTDAATRAYARAAAAPLGVPSLMATTAAPPR